MSSTEEKRPRAVPKFGSFKPKPTTDPEPQPAAAPGAARTPETKDGDPGAAEKSERSTSDRDRDRDRDRNRHSAHRDRNSRHARDQHRDRDRDRGSGHQRRDHHQDRDSGRDRDRDRDRDRERDRRRDRERDREKNRENDNDRERHRSRQLTLTTSSGHAKPNSTAISANSLFTIDTKGDPLIIRYGGNERSKIPPYHRFGRGKILGSTGHLKIHREGARDTFSLTFSRDALGSAFRDRTLARYSRSKARRIKPSSSSLAQPAFHEEEFISLSPSKKRKRGDESAASSDDETPDYRSIYGKAKPQSFSSSSESESDLENDNSEETKQELSTTKSRSITLTRHLRAQPADVSSWLDLISLQDALFAENHGHRPRTADEHRALAELKLSLYQEALSHCPNPGKQKETLLEGMMSLGVTKVWDDKTAAKKWHQLIQSDRLDFNLWKAKLNWEMGRVGTCTFEGIKTTLVEKIKSLLDTLWNSNQGQEETCTQIIYVFLRLTRLLHDTGYSELAVAAWQAVLEGTFRRPLGDENPAALSASFADFWESEVPRFGEEGAQGWRHFVEAIDMGDIPETRTDKACEEVVWGDKCRAWAKMEQQRSEAARMPARTLDEVADDDPFRVVMFKDIEEFLVWFPQSVLFAVKEKLLDAFLVFCRLPTAQLSGEVGKEFCNDPFLSGRTQAFRPEIVREDPGLEIEVEKKPPEFGQQGGNMAISPDVLFSGSSWFRYLDKWSDVNRPDDTQVDLSWILGTLRQLVRGCEVEQLAEYYLAIEWRNNPLGIRKVAKALLKHYTSNLRLYNAYALMEFANGNIEPSYKVLESATNLQSPESANASQLLYNTWAWLHLQSSQRDLALVRLLSSVDKSIITPSSISPTLILKARTHFSSTRDFSASLGDHQTSTLYAESLLILDYLSGSSPCSEPTSPSQGNIEAALSTVSSFSQPPSESLLQATAHLLYLYALSGPHRPSFIRTQLRSFLSVYPSNIMFLSLLEWSTSSVPLLCALTGDPLRSVPLDTPRSRRFQIMHELRAGTVHSVKLAFESALLESDAGSCRCDVEVWRGYVRFAAAQISIRKAAGGKKEKEKERQRHKEKGRAEASEVFYRALAACPWAKEIYLEGFRDELGLGQDEMRAVVGTMAAKGLRVFQELLDG
ncbi:NRDE-2, necessary for RNA interference-domain-containing protein [Cladorrhinum samala]|uniref:NRDE-2, necessary for RNA interference-domain-containing protein n=1 Tax=Cladorrhinum samala TaxID=585594 RepID=A0AAV9H6D3_9PEZI|nr:NRDE-2, necessary for RNA interference-domain-containing protein [Cladorrhinum samala]